jgi:hypothetical protein
VAGSTEGRINANTIRIPSVPSFNVPAQRGLTALSTARATAREQHEARGQDIPAAPAPPTGYVAFRRGTPHRPDIRHDHGFLDDGSGNIDPSRHEEPTFADRVSFSRWVAQLEAAELLRPDLVDATTAYRHFLFGGGAPRVINYERFVANDSSGERTLRSAMEDTVAAAIELHTELRPFTPTEQVSDDFQIFSEAVGAGGRNLRYPYPATENWQKAIGAHYIWIEARVQVQMDPVASQRHFDIRMSLHVEDMYNFNPGAQDIATGTPDSANGRFEITGLGHEFLHTATLERSIEVTVPIGPVNNPRSAASGATVGRSGRASRPPDARR